MRSHLAVASLAPLAWAPLAAAQEMPVELPDSLTDASGIASAARTLAEAGADRLLLADLIGQEIIGSDGSTVGTVEDFVATPGGRVVAALVSMPDGTRLAVPYAAIKVVGAAETAGLEVPVTASELQEMGELRSLAESLAP
jgi:sporulation protein YlmC with PRC-barrel domain